MQKTKLYLKNEDLLLRLAARTNIDTGDYRPRIEALLEASLDWPYFLRKANTHHLGALAFR